MLGTPAAAPPKWLIDERPEILPVARDGTRHGLGSRRHCSLLNGVYAGESERIVEAVAQRYGRHPALVGWQTDNEYGNHDTVLSFGQQDLAAFQGWLRRRYGDVAALSRRARADPAARVGCGALRLSRVRRCDPVRPAQRSQDQQLPDPDALPPGPLQDLLPLRVIEVASLRPGLAAAVAGPQITGRAERWREWLSTELPARASFADGTPALVQSGNRCYLACWPDEDLLAATLDHILVGHAGLATSKLPPHVRLRRRGDLTFAFSYGPDGWDGPATADYLLGGARVEPQGVACWR